MNNNTEWRPTTEERRKGNTIRVNNEESKYRRGDTVDDSLFGLAAPLCVGAKEVSRLDTTEATQSRESDASSTVVFELLDRYTSDASEATSCLRPN